MNGVPIGWNEADPADTENAGLGDDRIRSIKTSARAALDDEHNWPSAGGATTHGYHRLGSARPYYGPQSNASSSGTDGRIMLTSDTSQLLAVGSGGTVFLGGFGVVSMMSSAGSAFPTRHQWVMDSGSTTVSSVITFAKSGFSGIPIVMGMVQSSSTMNYFLTFAFISAKTFSLQIVDVTGTGIASGRTAWWTSLGSVAL